MKNEIARLSILEWVVHLVLSFVFGFVLGCYHGPLNALILVVISIVFLLSSSWVIGARMSRLSKIPKKEK